MRRTFAGKLMHLWQGSQMHHVPVGQAQGKAVPAGLTRSRGGRNWASGGSSSIPDSARRRTLDFPALFFFYGEIRAGRGSFGSRSSARYQIQSHQPRHPRRCTDLLADEPFSSDFTAALNGHFDDFHSGFPCSSFSRARFRGRPPPVRDRQHLRGRPSNSRVQQLEAEKSTLWATRSAADGSCFPVGRKEARTALHIDARESSRSCCRPFRVLGCWPALASIITESDAVASSQTCVVWSSSLEGAMLGGFSSRSRSIRTEVLLQGSACCPCLPTRPPEPRVVPAAALRRIGQLVVGRQ